MLKPNNLFVVIQVIYELASFSAVHNVHYLRSIMHLVGGMGSVVYVYVSVYSGVGRDYYGDPLMHVEHCILDLNDWWGKHSTMHNL